MSTEIKPMEYVPPDTIHNLTKREHFAALIIQSIIQNTGYVISDRNLEILAEAAVAQADALIKALKKGENL